MSVKVGISGFGRIGRLCLRASLEKEGVEVVAVNNRNRDIEYFAYLFKNDTVHGRFTGSIEIADEQTLVINGKRIHFFDFEDASQIPWSDSGAEYIIDSTGKYKTVDKASVHLKGGAKKVVVSAPCDGAPTFVMGVNHQDYTTDMNVISNGSCTTNCLAPLAYVFDEKYHIIEGMMTTVHAMTASQNTVDGRASREWRSGRAALENIIPSKTGAAKALALVVPQLKGKIHCTSLRVPTLDVSAVNLYVRYENAATMDEIKDYMRSISEQPRWAGIIGYSDGMAVSSDFRTDPRTCVFDANASAALNDHFVQLVAWYDNEWAYAHKLVDLVQYVAKIDAQN